MDTTPRSRSVGCGLVLTGLLFAGVAAVFIVVGVLVVAGVVPNAGPVIGWVFVLFPQIHFWLGVWLIRAGVRSRAAGDRPGPPVGVRADETVSMAGDFPTVPPAAADGLPHPLQQADPMHPALGCGCAALAALSWNAILGIFVARAIGGFAGGNPDWFQALFLVPFVAAGLILIGAAAYAGFRWLVLSLAGRVGVAASAYPFAPGGRYELAVAQRGACRLTGVAAELLCEERATYVQGTNKRTETRVVERRPADVGSGADTPPLTAAVEVPAGAMHSFKAPNNEVVWKVRVTGRVLGLPYRDEFAAVVRPGDPARDRGPPARTPSSGDERAGGPRPRDGPDLHLELAAAALGPGEELAGAFVLPGGLPADAEGVELSVLWHTSGKGTEDSGVVHRRTWTAADGTLADLPNPATFAVVLPRTPWTYDGELIKIRWVARVEVRSGRTGEAVREVPFTLAPGGGA